jgi:hypothetical protein
MATDFLIAFRGDVQLWASYDQDTFCTSPVVSDRRFPAYLAPHMSEAEARQALLDAGADPSTITGEIRPKRARRG